jgi:hypothetical protein
MRREGTTWALHRVYTRNEKKKETEMVISIPTDLT